MRYALYFTPAPDDRLTCHVHGRWIHQCVASPVHVNPVTRHRWCRDCDTELGVVVDELAGPGHGAVAVEAGALADAGLLSFCDDLLLPRHQLRLPLLLDRGRDVVGKVERQTPLLRLTATKRPLP